MRYSRRSLGEGYLSYFFFGEVQLGSAHDFLCLPRIAGPDYRAGHGGMVQRPGNSDFSNKTVVVVGYCSHALD